MLSGFIGSSILVGNYPLPVAFIFFLKKAVIPWCWLYMLVLNQQLYMHIWTPGMLYRRCDHAEAGRTFKIAITHTRTVSWVSTSNQPMSPGEYFLWFWETNCTVWSAVTVRRWLVLIEVSLQPSIIMVTALSGPPNHSLDTTGSW